MSELSSLYAKITISKAARKAFLDSNINSPSNYDDWLPWLQNRQYSGSGITQANIDHITYEGYTSGSYLREWLTQPRSFGYEDFDEKNEIWLISMYEFSENYFEYINFLNVLRGVDRFVDKESDSFMLVHSYIWGDTESDVLISVSQGVSRIASSASDIPGEYIKEAFEHFNIREKHLAEKHND